MGHGPARIIHILELIVIILITSGFSALGLKINCQAPSAYIFVSFQFLQNRSMSPVFSRVSVALSILLPLVTYFFCRFTLTRFISLRTIFASEDSTSFLERSINTLMFRVCGLPTIIELNMWFHSSAALNKYCQSDKVSLSVFSGVIHLRYLVGSVLGCVSEDR